MGTPWSPSCYENGMTPTVRWLDRPAPYEDVLQAMRSFTQARDAGTPDEIWLVEHQPVYTLGQAGKPEHVLAPGDVPLVRSDRGGQVTYHGPGQLVAYGLIDLRRRGLFVKEYVALLEDAVIGLLHELGLDAACRLPGAPGVYVPFRAPGVATPAAGFAAPGDRQDAAPREAPAGEGLSLHGQPMAKIAALGIKVSNGRAYHGISLNVAMDLQPFLGINPCGYQGLHTTDLASQGVQLTLEQAGQALVGHWLAKLPPVRAPLPTD